jgi:lipopolysaccharide transport system permease protein
MASSLADRDQGGASSVGDDRGGEASSTLSVIRVQPTRGWVSLRLGEVWAYRELLYFLALRDVKVRYKQTAIGAAWAVIQPLTVMAVFTIVFGRLARLPSDGVPYAAFALAGLVPWTYFATNLQSGSLSLVSNTNLVAKVYFPRLCLPIAAVLAGLVDLAVSLVVLVVVVLLYGVVPGPGVLVMPGLVVLAVVACLGPALWLAAVNVRYRDVRQTVPFLVQLWLFASPVAYPSNLLDGPVRYLYALNPMVGVVEGFRWAFLGSGRDVAAVVLVSAASALAILVGGAFYFRRVERSFADVI